MATKTSEVFPQGNPIKMLRPRQFVYVLALLLLCLLITAAGCAPPSAAPPATQAPDATHTPTPEPVAGLAPAPTVGAAAGSASLPEPFDSDLLLRGVQPQAYIEDACTYLKQRWAPENSAPGTVVTPIMYHRVGEGAGAGGGEGVPPAYFRRTMAEARRLGYQTVTAPQAAAFLQDNAKIPERSLLLIVDDRRLGTVEGHFLPVLEEYDWTVTLGWIIADTDTRAGLWERLERLHASGRLDVQSHGLRHLYMLPNTPVKQIREEIFGPIPILEQHVGYRPVVFVWPGGNFTKKTVEVAREAGYQLGFTVFARGPLLYNWIPLGKEERAVEDPLLVLPRYWGSRGIIEQLGKAAAIGDQAKSYAAAHFDQEAAYYHANCGGQLQKQ